MSHPVLARRSSGVLLHLTSLPGRHGSGDLGAGARHFLDWLVSAGQTLWQILPLTPPGAGHSPYQSPSAFAGNPWLIDLDELVERGWLEPLPEPGFDAGHCAFDRVIPYRRAALYHAWAGFQTRASDGERQALQQFCDQHAGWLNDYARFMVLEQRQGAPWTLWPAAYAQRDPSALATLDQTATRDLGFWRFVQWCFSRQWQALRDAAQARGVHIVGDLPIFVSHHSADVWSNAAQFQLGADGAPQVVAGVPPDYFSASGQRWGNPLYRWDVMATDGYRWWKDRLAHLLTQVDLVRLDHFRAFDAYWAIPADEPTAIGGHWRPGPGHAFFNAIAKALGPVPLIAEDLGIITDSVSQLRLDCGFPGLRVMQFAFDGKPDNPYLPHNFVPQTVVYSGTHDNTTTLDWWQQAAAHEHDAARHYLGPQADREIHWAMIQSLSQSVARTLVIPFQDVLGLDGHHRMNTPGVAEGCWSWRFDWSMVDDAPSIRLKAMMRAHGRV